jgi:signal transduction histidine kinase
MKKQDSEFYIVIAVWLLSLIVACVMWLVGDETVDISRSITFSNIALVACLYLLFLFGFLLSHGLVIEDNNNLTKVLGLALSSFAVLGLSVFFFFGMVALLSTMLVMQLVHYLDEKIAFVVAILVPSLGVLVDVLLGRGFEYPIIVIYGTFNVLVLLTVFRLIAEGKAKSESEQLVRELKATQILLSATTKRDERLRISRDLHDTLGHKLTALKLQLEVARHVKDEARDQHLQQAMEISNTLLSDVRATVTEFRNKKDFDLGKALETLTQGLTELRVKLFIDLDEALIDARQVEVIFRCVQEALTNIVKHSNASACEISLSIEAQSIVLSVQDNGQNPEQVHPGNGLTGMMERVVKIDGELDYQTLENGFNLTARFPINI